MIINEPEVRGSGAGSELAVSGRIVVAFMDAGALVDGDAVSGGVQGLALGAVASLHALAPAFRVGGDVVTRPGARVPAHLVHLTPAAVDTCSITSHITFYATIHFILFVTMGCVYLLVDGKSQSINRDSI